MMQGYSNSDIGSATDGGPSQSVTRTFVTSADATGLIDLTTAPAAGLKATIVDLVISVAVAMTVTIQMETTGNVLAQFYMPATSTLQITPRGFLKADAAAKKIQLDASVAGNISVTTVWFTEA